MGSKLNLQNESDNIYVQAVHQIGKIFYYRIIRPWTYFNFIFYYLIPKGRLEQKLVKIIHSFTNKVIEKKERNFIKIVETQSESSNGTYNYSGRKKLAMLDLLLNVKLINGTIDDEGIKDEVNTFLFEGHDTTAMALCFILMLLANNKDVQDRIYEELMQNFQKEKTHLTLQELNDLKYMEYAIKECLRLYPSVPFIARVLEENVITKDGLVIPQGSNIYIHIFDIHRNTKYWPNPDKFDPERFTPENSVNRHPFAYVPFSAGPRNCIGQKFAMLELKAVLVGILRNFILQPVDTPETILLVPDVVLRPQHETVLVKFIKRT